MNLVIKQFHVILFLLLGLPTQSFSQNNNLVKPSTDEIKTAAREIITNAGTCALITVDSEGRPRARAMDPFTPEEDFTIWFGTNNKSRKVNQIKNNPNVTLYYLDSDGSGYVMVCGKAEIVNTDEAKLKWWKQEWEAFYPNKEENYTLIKVTPEWMEISSEPREIYGDSVTWQPASVKF